MRKILAIEDCDLYAQSKGGICKTRIYVGARVKMEWECVKKHIFWSPFRTVREGHWCPECSGNKKIEPSFVEKTIKDKGGILLNKYTGSGRELKIQCVKDNYIWTTTWDRIKGNHWCPKCANQPVIQIDNVINLVESKNGKVINIKLPLSAKSKIMVLCLKDCHIWNTTWDYLKQGNWCPKCAGKILKTYDEFNSFIQSKGGIILKGPKKFNCHSEFKIKCLKDNYTWKSTYFRLSTQGHWCSKCAGKILKTYNEVQEVVKNKGGVLIAKKEDLKNGRSKLRIECEKGHTWDISYANLMNNDRWCPECIIRRSQNRLIEIIKLIFPNYTIYYNFCGFNWLENKKGHRQHFDIYIVELKLAIEYDGEQHFIAIEYFGGAKKLEEQKQLDAIKNEKVKLHSEDVACLIRFNYKEKIDKDYVIKILKENNIPLP